MHFLVSIFEVRFYVVLPMMFIWIVGGCVAIESFLASFFYLQLADVFDDLGEIVDPPKVQSPSPISGTLQIVARYVKGLITKRKD
jgi:hypothetical protein